MSVYPVDVRRARRFRASSAVMPAGIGIVIAPPDGAAIGMCVDVIVGAVEAPVIGDLVAAIVGPITGAGVGAIVV